MIKEKRAGLWKLWQRGYIGWVGGRKMKSLSDTILIQLNNIFKTYKIFFVKASDNLTQHFDVFFFRYAMDLFTQDFSE